MTTYPCDLIWLISWEMWSSKSEKRTLNLLQIYLGLFDKRSERIGSQLHFLFMPWRSFPTLSIKIVWSMLKTLLVVRSFEESPSCIWNKLEVGHLFCMDNLQGVADDKEEIEDIYLFARQNCLKPNMQLQSWNSNDNHKGLYWSPDPRLAVSTRYQSNTKYWDWAGTQWRMWCHLKLYTFPRRLCQ